MRATIAFAAAALATTVLAAPAPGWEHEGKWKNEWRGQGYGGKGKGRGHPYGPPDQQNETQCLTPEQWTAGAEIFRQLITNYSDPFALEALTEDFIDYSSAVNIIRNRGNDYPFTVDAVTFNGRAAFMAAQGAQPLIPFETLGTWGGCDTISTRWRTTRSANGQATESNDIPVVGLGVLKTRPDAENQYGFRVAELYSEFNAAAWLVNNGVFTPSAVTTTNFPEATAAPQKRAPPPWAGI